MLFFESIYLMVIETSSGFRSTRWQPKCGIGARESSSRIVTKLHKFPVASHSPTLPSLTLKKDHVREIYERWGSSRCHMLSCFNLVEFIFEFWLLHKLVLFFSGNTTAVMQSHTCQDIINIGNSSFSPSFFQTPYSVLIGEVKNAKNKNDSEKRSIEIFPGFQPHSNPSSVLIGKMTENNGTKALETLPGGLILQKNDLIYSPREIRAGTASMLIQNDTQETTTTRKLGTYVWTR